MMATQNPLSRRAPTPSEAQLDHFLLNVLVAYPDAETEQRILLVRAEAQALAAGAAGLSQEDLFAARQAVLSAWTPPLKPILCS